MNYDKFALPVSEVIPQIKSYFKTENTLIVTAPPGAGKSTLLPLSLMDENWLEGRKILILEPRRLAAKSIATRMSCMIEEAVGERIGYRIRHEKKISKNTRIEVVTEGMLIRMLQKDNMFDGIGMVIFDEFHERNLFSDISLALCREVQDVLRPDLRILMMSATLDLSALSRLLKCPVIESRGRMFPVDIRYSDFSDDAELVLQVISTVSQALKNEYGDILVFLPGEGEIKKCEEQLFRICSDEIVICPLYGQLPFDKQQKAIVPDEQGRRKIVLATSIAETSLTIQGIRIVVDSGRYRSMQFNPATEMSRLQTMSVSKDMADQRAGRAGRTQEGICYRLWTKATHERLLDHRTAEILQSDLTPLMLDMAMWGVTDIKSLTWLTLPPTYALDRARKLLEDLGALEQGKITPYGKKMHALACHPRLAHMLLSAEHIGQVSLAADIAALLEERDPMSYEEAGADICLRLQKMREYRKSRPAYSPLWQRILKSAQAFCSLLKIAPESEWIDNATVGFLLSRAFPERIAKAIGRGVFQLSNGQRARLSESDDLAHEEWLSIAHLDDRSGMGQIFLAASVRYEDLYSDAKEDDVVCWETRNGGLIARREWKIGQILLRSIPLQQVPDAQIADV
ncbi:MAG: ATP-dependent helicase HrpB, partial [Bacteroidales bacterium]